jgi:hypothetical protein
MRIGRAQVHKLARDVRRSLSGCAEPVLAGIDGGLVAALSVSDALAIDRAGEVPRA